MFLIQIKYIKTWKNGAIFKKKKKQLPRKAKLAQRAFKRVLGQQFNNDNNENVEKNVDLSEKNLKLNSVLQIDENESDEAEELPECLDKVRNKYKY